MGALNLNRKLGQAFDTKGRVTPLDGEAAETQTFRSPLDEKKFRRSP